MSTLNFKNIATGESQSVTNLSIVNGRVFFSVRGKGCGARFFNRNTCLVKDEDAETGTWLKCAEGWELAPTKQRTRKPRAKKAAAAKVAPQEQPQAIEEAQVVEEPVAKPQQEPSAASKMMACVHNDLVAKYGNMGGDLFDAAMQIAGIVPSRGASVNEEEVRKIVAEECKKNTSYKTIEVKNAKTINKVGCGVVNKDFDIFVSLVSAGKPLYMYGPAGSGKSYTAKQIADGLGLPYYETSQALFAHELKGYGDAAGKFVETAFYRGFSGGGVFFLDEVDASAPEALVVLNNAIANKRFDFPVIGNVDAHPNFRVIAAGNTRMTGATMEYTARQMQDTSFKNRFFFATVTYDEEIFMSITGGDKEIVNFGADLRRAARKTGISQLFSYRQASDLATLQACCNNDDAYLLRGSVLQEKDVDDTINLYENLEDKNNRWAKAMKKCISIMKKEEVW